MVQHRAPRRHLPGDAAGGRPGWQDRLTTKVVDAERDKAAARGNGLANWPAKLTLVSSIEWRRLLREAALSRGMSSVGYARRAVSAFIAYDLGLPFAAVTHEHPRPAPPGGNMTEPGLHPLRNPGRWPDDGAGHGRWEL